MEEFELNGNGKRIVYSLVKVDTMNVYPEIVGTYTSVDAAHKAMETEKHSLFTKFEGKNILVNYNEFRVNIVDTVNGFEYCISLIESAIE